jgi:hypothetical protein
MTCLWAVFGADALNNVSQSDMAANHPRVQVPRGGGLRNGVSSFEKLLEGQASARVQKDT